ncbi:MAG: hypothetical protein J6N72_07260, partial [Psychrobacter sp.]|nr:hypothetical protein [Psychrobacter sp.]
MYKRDAGAYRTDDRFAFNTESARSYMSGAKPFTAVGSTALLALFVLTIIMYVSSFLLPALMLFRSFYTPLLLGVVLPVAIIGSLALILNGSIILAILALVVAVFITVALAVLSGNHSDENSYYSDRQNNNAYEWV